MPGLNPIVRFSLLFLGLMVACVAVAQTAHGATKPSNTSLEELDTRIQQAEQRGDYPASADIRMEKAGALLAQRRYDEALSVYRDNMAFCEKNGLPYAAAKSRDALAEMLRMRGNNREALALFQKSQVFYQNNGHASEYASDLSKIGAIFLHLGELDSTQLYLQRSLALKEQAGDSATLTHPLNYLSQFYQRLGDWDKALFYQLRAVSLKKMQNDSSGLAGQLVLVANIFAAQKNWPKTEEYAREAYQLAEQLHLRLYKARALTLLAATRQAQGHPEQAIGFQEEAVSLLRQSKSGDLTNELLELAELYEQSGRPTESAPLLEEAYTLANQADDQALLAKTELALGELAIQNGQWQIAQDWLEKSLANAQRGQSRNLAAEAYRAFSNLYERKGQADKALDFLQKYFALKDTLLNENQLQATRELETRYQLKEKENAIQLLQSTTELQALRLREARRRQWGLAGGLLALGLVSGLAIYGIRLKQRSNRNLAEKNAQIVRSLQEKELLLREIHHRVKNNLQVISSLLKLQSAHLSADARQALNEGRNRVHSMALIHQDLYRDEGNLTAIDAGAYIGKLTDSLFRAYNIRPEKIALHTDIDPIQLDVDTAVPLGLIINELISNALKHAFQQREHGRLEVRLKQQGDQLLLHVGDDGPGMPADTFDTGKTAPSFGAQLVGMLTEKLGGRLRVSQGNGNNVELTITQFKLAPPYE